MTHYRVRFIKTLCDDTGHPHRCIEGIVDVCRARSWDRAVLAAKHRFKRMKRIPQWDFYADTFEVVIDQEGQRQHSGHAR
jgi:hypothetical protein